MATFNDVLTALGATGADIPPTIRQYYDEVIEFLVDAGVKESNITSGVVAIGVSDLWNYGAGEGKLSEYFKQRAAQLSYKS